MSVEQNRDEVVESVDVEKDRDQAAPRKKVGRPKKVVDPNAPVPEKRKPGRPKGSKNKSKVPEDQKKTKNEKVASFDDKQTVVASLYQSPNSLPDGVQELVENGTHTHTSVPKTEDVEQSELEVTEKVKPYEAEGYVVGDSNLDKNDEKAPWD